MRILIIGAGGMLGHKLYQRLREKFDVFATIRSDFESIKQFGIFEEGTIIENVEANDIGSIKRAIDIVRPDHVINAVGVIKQLPSSKDVVQTLSVNSILPHQLAHLAADKGSRLILISTDCVFAGTKGNYSETDTPDARDLYGLSKVLGEVYDDNSLTLRTSIIGRELATTHSLVEWFLANRGKSVDGFVNAIYAGFPTIVFADIIAQLISDYPVLTGLYHVSSDPISKFDLLGIANRHYQADIEVKPFDDIVIDRSLDSTKFRNITGFRPEPWDDMIRRMADDPTPYDKWRSGKN